jgi:Fe-S-cluster formation regulator IscX/YfhJ
MFSICRPHLRHLLTAKKRAELTDKLSREVGQELAEQMPDVLPRYRRYFELSRQVRQLRHDLQLDPYEDQTDDLNRVERAALRCGLRLPATSKDQGSSSQ